MVIKLLKCVLASHHSKNGTLPRQPDQIQNLQEKQQIPHRDQSCVLLFSDLTAAMQSNAETQQQ